ncbi:MAG: GAF domain-containing sensor histidine kinase [Cytophagales bacterium]|nr:GAF domain-containing sensor histidine kinase [Cytophagales bacterium]
MQHAQKPANELERLEALIQYDILDSDPEDEYDNIASLAAHICQVPVAIVSFIDQDRKWHKAKVGIAATEMKRDIAVCSHTIVADEETMIVEDTRNDDRFENSPVNQGNSPVVFYAGVKLRSNEGFVLGTLCVVDHKPNKITEEQEHMLARLGQQVMHLLEYRRNLRLLRSIKDIQRKQYNELEEFTHTVIHDINSPMANVVGLADLLDSDIKYSDELDKDTVGQYVGMIKKAGINIQLFMTELLDYYRSDSLSSIEAEEINFKEWIKEVTQMLDPHGKHRIELPEGDHGIRVRKVALRHVFTNLIQNAIKHNPDLGLNIKIFFEEKESKYAFHVSDDGKGIRGDTSKIFEPLVTMNGSTSGTGLGLAIVKKIVEKEGGTIELLANENAGATFNFTINKG